MNAQRVLRALIIVLAATTMGFVPSCQPQEMLFVAVSEPGLDPADHEVDRNDYPWAMRTYAAADADTGYVYLGTGNSVMDLFMERIFGQFGLDFDPEPYTQPPEIRRYRPDLGATVWETVLDYRDVETGPDWETSGFRALGEYTTPSGTRYLYAGSFGVEPTLWRSETGDSGSWEAVWTAPHGGSIRALTEHAGLLFIAVTHDFFVDEPIPGGIYATDGAEVWPVVTDGFGNPNNWGIYELASFDGWLYAGTYNREEGYEVWKLDGLDTAIPPERILEHGGPSPSNQAAATMLEFNGALYVGAIIFAGINTGGGFPIRGADMVRILPGGAVETVVGPGGFMPSGFGKRTHAYLWSLAEYEGKLYCGVWDSVSFVRVTQKYLPQIQEQFGDMSFEELMAFFEELFGKRNPNVLDRVAGNGAALYVTSDGEQWTPVFQDGLGNPDNYGVRQMAVHEGHLYLGLANIFDGLQVFRTADCADLKN